MAFIGSYLVLGNQPIRTLKPEDGAGPVLDALAAQSELKASIATLAKSTSFDPDFVTRVIDQLTNAGMIVGTDDLEFRLTDFGVKARFLVKR